MRFLDAVLAGHVLWLWNDLGQVGKKQLPQNSKGGREGPNVGIADTNPWPPGPGVDPVDTRLTVERLQR